MNDLTAVIVDDEPLARSLLKQLLESEGVKILGEAADGEHAIELAFDLQPDLLFLDIEMPGARTASGGLSSMSGLDVAADLAQAPVKPLVVFVTGYAEHAPMAFDLDSLDYLLKPVGRQRLAQTLARARNRLPGEAKSADTGFQRLPVREDYVVHFIRFADILLLEASDRRVLVHTADREYRTWYTLKYLEEYLPPTLFVRVHDAYIVQMEAIEDLLFLGNHTNELRLSNHRRIPIGRSRYPALQTRLGISGRNARGNAEDPS